MDITTLWHNICIFLSITTVFFVAIAAVVFITEDCEHLLARGKGQGHD